MTVSLYSRWLFLAMLVLPLAGRAAEPAYDCAGKTHFIHRGAPSTVPADATRSYRVEGEQIDGMPCQISDGEIACHGLTPQQAYRRLVIDRTAGKVKDTMELPTSMLVFEGQCK
ncbi:MAG: hypothetical protein RL404_1337 [Pseudomonadota bacterium]|jgi:hypothetical protein